MGAVGLWGLLQTLRGWRGGNRFTKRNPVTFCIVASGGLHGGQIKPRSGPNKDTSYLVSGLRVAANVSTVSVAISSNHSRGKLTGEGQGQRVQHTGTVPANRGLAIAS